MGILVGGIDRRVFEYIEVKGGSGLTPTEIAVAWFGPTAFPTVDPDLDHIMPSKLTVDSEGNFRLWIRSGLDGRERERVVARLLVRRAMRDLDCFDAALVSDIAENLLHFCTPTALTRSATQIRARSGLVKRARS